MMENQDQVLVGESGNRVFIRVVGRGNFQNSHPMKQFALAMIEQDKTDLVVDLKDCTAMDSTFMGVLAGLAIKLKKEKQTSLKLVQVSSHNRELLDTLGLIHLLDIIETPEEGAPDVAPVDSDAPDKKKVAEHMLEAHEILSDLSETNKAKFKNVIAFIQEDLGKE